jgi:hypothetical protein
MTMTSCFSSAQLNVKFTISGKRARERQRKGEKEEKTENQSQRERESKHDRESERAEVMRQ